MSNLERIAQLGQKPLPEGVDDFSKIMYDEDYEKLGDLFSASYLSDKDWSEIVELAEKVFTDKTKHIQVLQWFCEALINTDGYEGLSCALNILLDLSVDEAIWKTIDPLKDNKKASAIRNFEEAIIPWVEGLEKTPENLELIKHILAKIAEIKIALKERFKDSIDEEEGEIPAPSLSLLQEAFSVDSQVKSQETKILSETSKEKTSKEAFVQKENVMVVSCSITKAEDQAFFLADEGKLSEGLELLQQGFSQASFLREKFFWTLAQVRLLYSKEKIELALFHLKILEKNIDQYKLEEWEPQISIDVAELFLKCCDKKEKLKKTSDREKAYNRLRRLDMARSLNFEL